MATTYKLCYFKARGNAESARFIFAQAGVKYEDVRYEREEWAKVKPTTPTGKLPMLEVGDVQLPGSVPIDRYLGEKFGLAGSNDLENALIASIVDVVKDFREKMGKVYSGTEEEKKAAMKKIVEEEIPAYWGVVEKMIQKNNSDEGWSFGKSVTYVDFYITTTLDYVLPNCPDFSTKFPGVFKVKTAVEALPNIAKWIAERPKTEY